MLHIHSRVTFALATTVALAPAEEAAVAERNQAEERQGTCLNLQRKSIAEARGPASCDIPALASQEAAFSLLYAEYKPCI